MTLRGVEPAVSALQTRLAAQLPTHVAAINATVTDGITIHQPEQVLDYLPSAGEILAFPTVGIEHGQHRLEDDTGHEATGVANLIVVAFVQHAEPRDLARYVRRYHLAVMRAALDSRNLGVGTGVPWGVTYRGGDFGPALKDKLRGDEPPNTYWTWCAVGLVCKYDES